MRAEGKVQFRLGSNLNHRKVWIPMIKADRLHSTPPLNSSSIPTREPTEGLSRRHMLAGLATLPALPAAAAVMPPEVDPIFALIEAPCRPCRTYGCAESAGTL
jgi:hypothetical protein